MKFQGSKNYVATQDLMLAVNAAITLKRPLLIKGEPGTGKTMLAEEVAAALNMPLLQWHVKSTTKAQQGLYEYDAVSRLRDSQMADLDGGDRVKNIENYIIKGVLWQAFTAKEPVALLIDEIDKADIEFPNIRFVDLVNQQRHRRFGGEGLPEHAFDDVVVDIFDPLTAVDIGQLRIAQSAHGVVFIQALLRFGGRFDVPLQQRHVQGCSHFLGQHGFAGTRLAFDQQRAFEGDGSVDRQHQVLRGYIIF